MAKVPGKGEECYLCGSEGEMTKDHIPPRGIFPRPLPSNLVTMPCCLKCNQSFHADDEYFRTVVSAFIDRTNSGKTLWDQRVVPNTIKRGRIKKALSEMRASAEPVILPTSAGWVQGVAFEYHALPIERVLVRMTRGFLRKKFPEIDQSLLDFRMAPIVQFRFDEMAELLNQMPSFSIGGEVFTCWVGAVRDKLGFGIWFYQFHRSAAYSVEHKPKHSEWLLPRETR